MIHGHPYRDPPPAPAPPIDPPEAALAWAVLAATSVVQLLSGAQLLLGALGLGAGALGAVRCAGPRRRAASSRGPRR